MFLSILLAEKPRLPGRGKAWEEGGSTAERAPGWSGLGKFGILLGIMHVLLPLVIYLNYFLTDISMGLCERDSGFKKERKEPKHRDACGLAKDTQLESVL